MEAVALVLTREVSDMPGAYKQQDIPYRNIICNGSEAWEHLGKSQIFQLL